MSKQGFKSVNLIYEIQLYVLFFWTVFVLFANSAGTIKVLSFSNRL